MMTFICVLRNEDCLKYLLETGCDIEAKDNNQRTPVHWAVQSTGTMVVLLVLFFMLTVLRKHQMSPHS